MEKIRHLFSFFCFNKNNLGNKLLHYRFNFCIIKM